MVAFFLDFYSKKWALHLQGVVSYNFIKFKLVQNPGALLGLFSELPTSLRIISLSTMGIFIVCTFAIIQYILPIQTMKFRIGLSCMAGGIVSNVYDRIIHGSVTDFIILGSTKYTTSPFNIADSVQILGYILVSIGILKNGDLISVAVNKRKKLWINKTFQLKFILFILLIGITLTTLGASFSYTYLKYIIKEISQNNKAMIVKYTLPFLYTYIVISIAFSLILIFVGRILSHRSAGPIYAFEVYVDELLKGRSEKDFKLRKSDDFKQLEKIAKKLNVYTKNKETPDTFTGYEITKSEIKKVYND